MLESVAAGLLNKYLGTYVDNLNTSQLNLGVWSGDIKLRNLRLKKDALDKLNLPIDVMEGYLGELTIKIAWHALSSQPVRVRIDDVYLLASPRDSANSTPEEDAARAQAAKMEKLENAELLSTQSSPTMSAEEEKKNQSFIESLTSKVTSNLQLEIKNLHIRYEDKISVPGHPFSVGVTLSNFSMISTDSEWQPAFITDSTGAIHKLASLDSLAVYFDTDSTSLAGYPINEAITKFTQLISRKDHTPKHQFILKPVSGTGRFVVNKRANSQVAKLDTELLFNELGFVLDADQYRDALSMVDLFHFYTRQREYRIYQPPQEEIDRNRNRALWKFAITAIKTEVHDKHKTWSWAYFAERRDDRKAYVALFKSKTRGPLSPEDTETFSALERKLSYKDLRFYRSIARSELRKERAEHPVEAKAKTTTAKASSWVGSWVGWATGAQTTEPHETEENSTALNEEQRKELYKAIDWDEKDAVTSSIDYPKDTLMYRARIKLETGSFTLRTDPHGSSKDLIALNFDDFRFDLGKRVETIEATLGLGGLRVFDGTCEGSLHSQIVRVKELTEAEIAKEKSIGVKKKLRPPPEEREADEDVGQYDEGDDDDEEEPAAGQELVAGWSADSQPFFSLKFEHQPLDNRADNALAVRLRHTEIVYHKGYVEAIVAFFKPPESQLESVGALIDVASETLEGIRKETRAGLEFALAQHKTVDVHLDLNAPIIIIPEDVTLKNCQHVVLDAGHISVESDLADQSAVDTVKAKERQEYGEEDYQRLESLMYDKFYVKLEDAQLLMGPTLQVCLDALEGDHIDSANGAGELHILERTSLKFLAQNCILNEAPNLTRFKISGSLPSLQLNFSDRKYKSMMRMIDVAIPKFNGDAEKNVTTRPALAPAARHTSFAQSKSKVPKDEDDEDLHISEDTASEGSVNGEEAEEEEEKEGGKDEFFDTPDIADGKQNIHQKTFEFTFSVDRVQASIFRSNVDPVKPDLLLANTVLEGFKLEFGLRPYDMSVDVLLRSLYIEDKIGEQDSDFRHLVTSEKLDGSHAQDLVRVRYQGVQKDSPEFMTVHEGFDKSVDVEMSTLNLVITRNSILVLFDWIMTTFTDPEDTSAPPSPAVSIDNEEVTLEETSTDKLRVKVKLTSINLILNEDGLRLATLSLSAADVSVLLRSPTIRVSARLGNLTLDDNFSTTSPQEMLSIQGDELADFRYETYDPLDKSTYPGYESSVHLRTGSLQFSFRTEPVHRILVFFTKFGRMKAVYDAATQAAAQRANEMQTLIPKMHYDVLVRTPIVVFPNEEGSPKDVVTARLGEISLSNEFEVSEEQVITKINFGLHEVGLESTFEHDGEPHTLEMLQDVRIDVNVKLSQNIDQTKQLETPGTLVSLLSELDPSERERPKLKKVVHAILKQIHAKMSDVKMNLTQAQYGMLIRLSRTIPQAFSLIEEEVEDVANGSQPEKVVKTSNGTERTAVENTGTTIDLLPELSSEGKDADGHPVALRSTVELSFESGTIYLELFTLDAISPETLGDASLARFSLNETAVKYKLLSDNSMEAEVAIRSLTVHDTRPSRLTQFREIIPASKRVDNQFMIQYSHSGGLDRSSMANVAIDSPKIIFSLDPVFALLDFFTSAFPPSPENDDEMDESLKEADEQIIDPNPPTESTFALRLNVTSPTIILLANPEKADSEAVVLSINQIEMSQQGTTALSVKKMGMFLRRMDKPKDTIRVLDDLDLTVSMDSRADAGRQVTSIEVAVDPVILRVSLRDILLINSIVNRAIELSNRSNAPQASETSIRPALETSPSGAKTRGRSKSEVTRMTRTQTSSRVTDAALRAQIIVSKETLRATVDGFQLILIGDMHDLPLLDVKAGKFVAKAKDWSTDLDASVMIKPHINYFNLKVSHWEPLVDPWEFVVSVTRSVSTGRLNIGISSKKRLELNLTASFIEIALTTSTLLDRDGGQLFRKPRGSNAPFLLKNRTGYALGFAKTSSKSHQYSRDSAASRDDGGSKMVVVADGKDIPWRFDDWRTMRENVNATNNNQLDLSIEDSGWEKLKQIHVDREGEHVHTLRPKLNSVYHRLLCEVKLVDNVKVVTFRSTFLVENRSLVNAEMVIVDASGKKSSKVYNIPPGEDCAVPILSAYNDRIKIRPDGGFGYAWPAENLHWQDLVKRPSRAILCKNPQGESFRFQAYTVHDKGDPSLRTYPRIALRLHAPLEVQNLLPHDIEYRCFDREVKHNWKAFLRAGGVSPVHVAELSHLLLMCVQVQDTALERSGFSIINSDNPEDLPVENELVLADKNDLKLNLRLHYQKHENAGGAFRVQIYSPYILINKTGLDFGLKTKPFFGQAKHVAGQEMTSSKSVRPENDLFMFSFPNDDRKNRVLLRVGESSWSKPLSFETVGHESEVVLPSANGKEEIRLGLKVTEGLGDYKLTKVITLCPRFIVKNNFGENLRIRELGSTKDVLVPPGERHDVGFVRAEQAPQLVLSFAGTQHWSASFKLQDIGQNYVRVPDGTGGERLARVDAVLEGPCIFIRIDPETGSWPFLLRNDSDYPIEFYQCEAEGQPVGGRKSATKRYHLASHGELPYAWDYPADNRNLRIVVGHGERTVNPLEIGALVPFRFSFQGHTRTLSIDVRAESTAQVIAFSNYAEEASVFKLQRRNTDAQSRPGSVMSNRDVVFEEVDVDNVTTFSFSLNLEGIGISVVNKSMQELVYASFRGLTAKYSDSTTNVAYELGVKWIQIDNQLFGGIFPILLYPSVIPKDGKELEVHPSLQASAIILKDRAHGVTYFKYASILLQEMTIEVDEDFLFAFLDFAKFSGASGTEPPNVLTEDPKGIPEPTATSKGGDLYFEVLHLQPMQLDLSFMRTDRVNADQKVNSRNPLFFLVNILAMAIGNVNDAPVRFNALVIENARLSLPVLQSRLTKHYSTAFTGQLYRVLGSADVIGNPVGLFTNVSSGVADFFIQPYDSIMLNGNEGVGIGIARGAGSLAKKTVFGLSDSLAKVSGSIGKGLSAATLDQQYQNQRRMRQYRNKPKHALYGVTAGAASLVTSVASGFEGLATKPLEGAESGGAAGFLTGVGKGLVGAVTKPVVGIFDFANNVTEGIRNTTTVFDQTGIDRVRLPRFTASDGVLRPYSEREALGQNWLKNAENGKWFDDVYVAHLDISPPPPSGPGHHRRSDETIVCILTTTRLLLIRIAKLKLQWDVPFIDLSSVSLEPSGISLTLKDRDGGRNGVDGPFLAIGDQTARLWFFQHIERIVQAHNARRHV